MSKKAAIIQDYFVLIHKPGHPRAVAAGYVPEQVLVAEQRIGRLLTDDEEVRHINGDPKDNRPTNLEIISMGNSFKSQAVENSPTSIPRKTSNKTFISCKFQRVCWKTVRAPIARQNGVYLPYVCSWQSEGEIYDCSRYWGFYEKELEEKK